MNLDFLNTNCYRIIAIKEEVHFLQKPFLLNQKLSILEFFLLDRFVQHHPWIKNVDNWEINHEDKTARLKEKILLALSAEFRRFSRDTLTQQVHYLLKKEYGYLPAQINENQEWSLYEVSLAKLKSKKPDLIIPERVTDYLTQLHHGKEIVAGMFIPQRDYYVLIDGYHRLLAVQQHFSAEDFVWIVTMNPEY